jgi:hypothetical protein
MVKFFKIIEKIVWIIAALTIATVLAMVFIGAFANLDKAQFDWSSLLCPHLSHFCNFCVVSAQCKGRNHAKTGGHQQNYISIYLFPSNVRCSLWKA